VLACGAAWQLNAQAQLSVDQLVSFIRSSIQLKHNDKQVAEYVRKLKLTNKLDEGTVETLQGMGAGPQTVAALKTLMTATASLTPAPPPPPKPVIVGPPPPDSIEQKRILAAVTENALNYTSGLPNFICMQVTRRYVDQSGMESYHLADTIAERLSYFDHHEDYKVALINNVPVQNVSHEQLGGATSSGEFGSIMAEIFAPESNTKFDWERWATLRGKRMHVFSYRVPLAYSKYTIRWGNGPDSRTIVTGYRGLIYADRENNNIMRITVEAENMPVDFPIQKAQQDLNYDYTRISGQEFLLPLKAENRLREGKYLVKNEVEFRLYNRFGADTVIQFGDVPDALPQDQVIEQPSR
jgi:hypothetical protein